MQLDLNLLAALDALLEEGSVAGAAERLHVTAPAMSRSLGRIRRTTGDQILVRTGRTMTPTPYAIAVREQVHELLQQVQGVLAPSRELDLTTLERTFTLRWHDSLVALGGPALLAAVREQAPGVRLRFLAESSVDTPELRRGEVDLEANADRPTAPDIRADRVAESQHVIVVRQGHPLTRVRAVTAAQYAAAEHITVSRRGRLGNALDDALARLGLTRRVVATAPTESTALEFVRDSDLLVTAPESTTRATATALGLTVLPLPFELPSAAVYLSWHQRYDTDPAHIWLRDLARSALAP
ncbi:MULTISPECIES: LysR family transcriptional regulator [Streptomyces]|uniref:LysR family transcriptional regulator n=2 Tax=Streptomyces rimosus subsp. rimosus TaxID=132474 RepID=L8EQU9_STRR1|nr:MULTISPECIES: LysR family transcriptional regulator [Streptomyces]KOG81532.1 LysR family transcriptional regulator [Kitasatospora aureofaciens]MYT42390.1 LysR family transcriptional regulator [Streptomyces sp. SID5471]KEF05154.1 LysR family transcriptional regulator [Streptomyces rimosus]KEF19427.1 LysR family transcriptional regulator [Streptomyces rimosus]KOT30931.1 LysR family transcriptional regulator [Streptomyces sp. NRRL WC-3701]